MIRLGVMLKLHSGESQVEEEKPEGNGGNPTET